MPGRQADDFPFASIKVPEFWFWGRRRPRLQPVLVSGQKPCDDFRGGGGVKLGPNGFRHQNPVKQLDEDEVVKGRGVGDDDQLGAKALQVVEVLFQIRLVAAKVRLDAERATG